MGSMNIGRSGDSCPAGHTFNMTTGACDAPEPGECEAATGITYHQQKIADILPGGGFGNRTPTPDEVCTGGCAYGLPAKEGHSFRFVSGNPAGAWQNYSYRGTGKSCTAGVTPDLVPPMPLTPSSDKSSECTNKVMDAEGRQSYSCTTADSYTDPGAMDCGEIKGEFQCLAKSPAPKQTNNTVKTDVVETPGDDGSKQVETTTTTTTTTCTGVGACQTTTTTNVNNSHVKGDGSVGSESNTCTGPGCKDGDGQDQEERKEEEKEESSVSGGDQCEAPPVCEGDPLQCELIRQQHKTRCDAENLNDFTKVKSDLESRVQGDEFKLTKTEIDIPSFITQGTRFLPSNTCPQPEIASTSGGQVAFSYEPMCRLASGISPLVIIAASLAAALFIFRD